MARPSENLTKVQLTELRSQFDRFDKNENGRIDVGEMAELLHAFTGEVPSDDTIHRALKALDTDNSGTIEFIEFADYMTPHILSAANVSRSAETPKFSLAKAQELGIDIEGRSTADVVADLCSMLERVNRGEPAVYEPQNVESMGVTAVGDGFHTDISVNGSEHKIVAAEPVDDGGSGQGPNPMQLLIGSLTSCDQEQAMVVAKAMGIAEWGPVDFTTDFVLNLDGYMGVAPHDLSAKEVFKSITVNAKVKTSATNEEVQDVLKLVNRQCPLRQLFVGNGVQIDGVWEKV